MIKVTKDVQGEIINQFSSRISAVLLSHLGSPIGLKSVCGWYPVDLPFFIPLPHFLKGHPNNFTLQLIYSLLWTFTSNRTSPAQTEPFHFKQLGPLHHTQGIVNLKMKPITCWRQFYRWILKGKELDMRSLTNRNFKTFV